MEPLTLRLSLVADLRLRRVAQRSADAALQAGGRRFGSDPLHKQGLTRACSDRAETSVPCTAPFAPTRSVSLCSFTPAWNMSAFSLVLE